MTSTNMVRLRSAFNLWLSSITSAVGNREKKCYVYVDTHTHTHTHIYIYIYTRGERERGGVYSRIPLIRIN
jgi:hypothetical protein